MYWQAQFQKAVTFSYDDGNEQDIPLLELLNRYGLKATFHVNTGLGPHKGSWQYGDLLVRRLDLNQAAKLYAGHEISVHGSTHQDLTQLAPAALAQELHDDIAAITAIFGQTPTGLSYPYGVYNDAVLEAVAQAGLRYGRGTKSTHSFAPQENLLAFQPTCHHDDPAIFDLVQQFLDARPAPGESMIFYIWGHSYELEGKRRWDHFKRLCQSLAGRPDIFYGTNAQVLLS